MSLEMNYSKTASRLKCEIISFADRISNGLSKPEKKAVVELLFGILSGGSCLVTEVSRRLKDPVKFKKILDRLTRHLFDDYAFIKQQKTWDIQKNICIDLQKMKKHAITLT